MSLKFLVSYRAIRSTRQTQQKIYLFPTLTELCFPGGCRDGQRAKRPALQTRLPGCQVR